MPLNTCAASELSCWWSSPNRPISQSLRLWSTHFGGAHRTGPYFRDCRQEPADHPMALSSHPPPSVISSFQASECLSSGELGSLKDPKLDAPADAVLRVAQLALSCTGERTAGRPSMAQIANELQAIRDEVVGKEELSAAVKVDNQVQEMKDAFAGIESLDAEIQMIGDSFAEGNPV
ncbi:unnamed protein product [Closterium sp. Yama58-4]|nr:unnamed protein product [Closterium sp. Yama58-4]